MSADDAVPGGAVKAASQDLARTPTGEPAAFAPQHAI